MTFDFTVKEFILGNGTGTPTLQFYRRGFNLGGSSGGSGWTDIILKGNTALTLTNAKANGLNYLKLFGECEQDGTPTPTVPVDIVCNNGALKMVDDELPVGYKRVLGYECDNNVLWQITNFKLKGSDTVRISFSVTGACNVFGCYQGADATDNYDLYASVSSGSKYLRYGSGTYLSYWSSSNLGQRFDVVFSPTGTSGMPTDSTWTPLTFESANDLLIGSTTLTGTSSKLKGNLYGNIIVDNRLKLIPCERVSDNSLGYYDTYSETFFEPTGTPTSLGYDGSHYVLTVDGTVETVEVTGKNILNPANIHQGTIKSADGAVSLLSNNRCYFDFIPVKSGDVFWFSAKNGTPPTYNVVFLYTSDNESTFISAIGGTAFTFGDYNGYKFDITQDGYIRGLFLQSANFTPSDVVDAQVIINDEPTSYEPYYNGGSATAEMLLKVGIYQDVQSVLDGTVTRNVGILVLDGVTVGKKIGTAWNSTYKRGSFAVSDMASTTSVVSDALCNMFPYSSTVYGQPTTGGFCTNNGTTFFSFLGLDSVTSSGDANAWLADQYNSGNPVVIVYPLATATTETVSHQHLGIQAGTNIVEITQASINNLPLEVSYKGTVTE